MKLTNELIKELDLIQSKLKKGSVCLYFSPDEYFDDIKYIQDKNDFENLPNRNELFKFQQAGWYDNQGIFYGHADTTITSTLTFENNEIISAHYCFDDESGDILEENIEKVMELWPIHKRYFRD
ncbi:MAG TPA: hypothetical protein VK982_07005, partial [Bacteroidales bacterium]|nr:hypothetical protein [Bacteroidales bacterium]